LALPWAVVLVPLTTVASVANGAFVARSAFGELSAINAAGNMLATLVPLAVASLHQALLPPLIASVVVVRGVINVWLLWRCWHFYATKNFRPFDLKIASQLMHFGGWATISSAVGPIMVIADRFAIGIQLGSQAVSYYVVPFQIAERITIFSAALNQVLFPRF